MRLLRNLFFSFIYYHYFVSELQWEAILGIVVGSMLFILFLFLLISCCIREQDIQSKEELLDQTRTNKAAPPADTAKSALPLYGVTLNPGRLAHDNVYTYTNEIQQGKVTFQHPDGPQPQETSEPQYSRVLIGQPVQQDFRSAPAPGQVNVFGPSSYDRTSMRPLLHA